MICAQHAKLATFCTDHAWQTDADACYAHTIIYSKAAEHMEKVPTALTVLICRHHDACLR